MTSARPVPVDMWSPESWTWECEPLVATMVSFAAGITLDTHTHERATVAVVLDGGFELHYSARGTTRSVNCAAGTVVLQPAGEPHRNHFSPRGARVSSSSRAYLWRRVLD